MRVDEFKFFVAGNLTYELQLRLILQLDLLILILFRRGALMGSPHAPPDYEDHVKTEDKKYVKIEDSDCAKTVENDDNNYESEEEDVNYVKSEKEEDDYVKSREEEEKQDDDDNYDEDSGYYLVELQEADEQKLKVIEWEDYDAKLARIWSVATTLETYQAKREELRSKLDSILQVQKQYLNRENELHMMKCNLESQKRRLESSFLSVNKMSKDIEARREELKPKIIKLSTAANCLSAAHSRLVEANKLLSGEGGRCHLRHLQKLLSTRQQLMTMQAASLYPITRISSKKSPTEVSNLTTQKMALADGSCSSSSSSDSSVESLTIAGLQLFAPPIKKLGFFNDKQFIQSSAAAFGYVAHIVKLVASYLDIPLRYPIRLGGSRTYIQDCAPSVEPLILELGTFGTGVVQKPIVEFPLFLEGQDQTRSAYAVYLLNKDIDQLLSYLGVPSFGPRHTLPNLKRLIKAIQSENFKANKTSVVENKETTERR